MHTRSSPQLTFGISLVQSDSWPELVRHVQQIEALGFDKVWLADHFVPPTAPDVDFFECWTALAGLAASTKRIRLGSLVSSMTLRNPALLARTAVTVDHISNGRLELGIGAAGASACHTMTGIPQWNVGERSARFCEFVEILDQMLEKEVTTYEGQYYSIRDAEMHPQPIQQPHPPLNIAAHGPKALRLAARYGDAWNCFNPGDDALTPKQCSDVVHRRLETLSEFALDFGRDPAEIGRTFLFGWTADRPFASLDALRDTVGRYQEAGVRDFAFLYLPGMEDVANIDLGPWSGQAITNPELLERIALEVIPELRHGSVLN